VLLHGWGLHGGAWDDVAPELARRFSVHAVDLPGHGHSAHLAVGSFEEAVDQVAAVVPQGALVCGWSLGGLIAQRLAVRHASRVGALALVAATPCFMQRDDWPHGMPERSLEQFAHELRSDTHVTLERFVRLNAMRGSAGRDAIRVFTARLTERGPPSPQGLEAALEWLRDVDLRGDAVRLPPNVLLLHGARDTITPIGAARWMAGQVPGATLVEIDDAAHLPFFTHREAFVAALEGLRG
jgi:pimeloyl-[acyl-carrier protein] methyl ester esterase